MGQRQNGSSAIKSGRRFRGWKALSGRECFVSLRSGGGRQKTMGSQKIASFRIEV